MGSLRITRVLSITYIMYLESLSRPHLHQFCEDLHLPRMFRAAHIDVSFHTMYPPHLRTATCRTGRKKYTPIRLGLGLFAYTTENERCILILVYFGFSPLSKISLIRFLGSYNCPPLLDITSSRSSPKAMRAKASSASYLHRDERDDGGGEV